MRRIASTFLAALAPLGLSLLPAMAEEVEQAKYSVVGGSDGVEIREYAPHIVAETSVAGNREQAANEGFRRIAGYIFGKNAPKRKIAMTAPVTQEAGENIAMTAPVTQQGGAKNWKVRFVMPSKHSMADLPNPSDPSVKLRQSPKKRYAAVSFSGFGGDDDLEENRQKLMQHLARNKIKAKGQPVFAFYDPPWTLPFDRRNEVMVEIDGR